MWEEPEGRNPFEEPPKKRAAKRLRGGNNEYGETYVNTRGEPDYKDVKQIKKDEDDAIEKEALHLLQQKGTVGTRKSFAISSNGILYKHRSFFRCECLDESDEGAGNADVIAVELKRVACQPRDAECDLFRFYPHMTDLLYNPRNADLKEIEAHVCGMCIVQDKWKAPVLSAHIMEHTGLEQFSSLFVSSQRLYLFSYRLSKNFLLVVSLFGETEDEEETETMETKAPPVRNAMFNFDEDFEDKPGRIENQKPRNDIHVDAFIVHVDVWGKLCGTWETRNHA